MASPLLEPGVSIEKLQQIKDRAQDLEESNARLREKAAALRDGQAALEEENESLCKEIEALEAELTSRQAKSKKGRKLKSEDTLVFVNRSGERWPRKPPPPVKSFVGIKYEKGAAVAALKAIFQQLFASVVDAANFFSTSLQEIISAAELTRGMARCHIRNLETEHLLFDLDRRIIDGISIRGFVEAFNWLSTPIIVTPQSMAASRARLPQTEQRVSEALSEKVAGFNALDYMAEKARSSAVSAQGSQNVTQHSGTVDGSNCPPPLDLKKVGRALNVREKYLLSHNQLENKNMPNWIAELSEAYYSEHELRPPQRNKAAEDKSIDNTILSKTVNSTIESHSEDATRVHDTGTVQLTTELVSAQEHPSVRRIMNKHEKILKSGRPVLSAVTADSTWIKQDRSLAAHSNKQAAADAFDYDLDGRLMPKPPPPARKTSAQLKDTNATFPEGGGSTTSPRVGKFKAGRAARDPYENASPANIAYMMLQKVSQNALAAYDRSEDDKVFQRFLDDVIKTHPRAGVLAKQILAREGIEEPTGDAEPQTLAVAEEPVAADGIHDNYSEAHDDAASAADKPATPPLQGAVSREISQELEDDGHEAPGTPPLDAGALHREVREEMPHSPDNTHELPHAEVSQEELAGEASLLLSAEPSLVQQESIESL